MTWIILTKKPPTAPSPPVLSIHWSIPWVNPGVAMKQFESFKTDNRWHGEGDSTMEEYKDHGAISTLFGMEHNETSARAILMDGLPIRVYDDEYNVVAEENLVMYLTGTHDGDPSHVPVMIEYYDVDPAQVEHVTMEGGNKNQGLIIATGGNLEPLDIRPVMWWRLHPQMERYYPYSDHEYSVTEKPADTELDDMIQHGWKQ